MSLKFVSLKDSVFTCAKFPCSSVFRSKTFIFTKWNNIHNMTTLNLDRIWISPLKIIWKITFHITALLMSFFNRWVKKNIFYFFKPQGRGTWKNLGRQTLWQSSAPITSNFKVKHFRSIKHRHVHVIKRHFFQRWIDQ